MSVRVRPIVELVLAVVAAAGSVASWLAARSTEMAPPVSPTEPSQLSQVYDPSLIALALVLVTVAGILAVVGIGRWRDGR